MGFTGRLLFALGLLLAALLVALVLVGPLVAEQEGVPEDWGRALALFGRDPALKRTCVASAVGLVVTACVFFRRGGHVAPARRVATGRPRSPGAAGA